MARLSERDDSVWHGTTILCVRKGNTVVVADDGQVSVGPTIMKANARKVRRLGDGGVIAGFAGATADALTLFERKTPLPSRFSVTLTSVSVVFRSIVA